MIYQASARDSLSKLRKAYDDLDGLYKAARSNSNEYQRRYNSLLSSQPNHQQLVDLLEVGMEDYSLLQRWFGQQNFMVHADGRYVPKGWFDSFRNGGSNAGELHRHFYYGDFAGGTWRWKYAVRWVDSSYHTVVREFNREGIRDAL